MPEAPVNPLIIAKGKELFLLIWECLSGRSEWTSVNRLHIGLQILESSRIRGRLGLPIAPILECWDPDRDRGQICLIHACTIRTSNGFLKNKSSGAHETWTFDTDSFLKI